MIKTGFAITLLGLAVSLAGCSPGEPFDDPFAEYSKRIQTISPNAGNAVAANTAIQTIDPWPRYVHNTRIPGDGPRMVAAVQRYEKGGGASSGASSSGSSTGTATGAASNVSIGSQIGAAMSQDRAAAFLVINLANWIAVK